MKRIEIKEKNSFQDTMESYEGESIEMKVKRIVEEKEPIKDGAPIIFTELKDGVRPEFDVRTDKWIIAMNAMDKVSNYEASKYLRQGEKPEIENSEGEKEAS